MIIDLREQPQFKYLLLVAMLYLMALLAAVVMVYKVVAIGKLAVSEATFIFSLTYFFSDAIAEVYGYKVCRQVIWYSLFSEFCFTLLISLAIRIHSPSFFQNQFAYDHIFGDIMRVAFANLLGIPAGAFASAYVISKWKILLRGKLFWLRSIVSNALGEFALSAIAVSIVWVGILPFAHVVQIIISTYLVKLIGSCILTYPVVLFVNFLKKKEGIDIYDYETDFNPFKLSST